MNLAEIELNRAAARRVILRRFADRHIALRGAPMKQAASHALLRARRIRIRRGLPRFSRDTLRRRIRSGDAAFRSGI